MTTLYEASEDGSVSFQSHRRAWGVSIPAFVYDLWMPLIGSDDIGVYGVYCRLERDSEVRGITMKTLAMKCRKGVDTLRKINERLELCGFIKVVKPEGWQVTAHYTTKIIVLDPPQSVSSALIEHFRPRNPDGTPTEWEYEPLAPWLVEQIDSKTQPGFPGRPNQVFEEDPDRSAKIDSSLIEPSLLNVGRTPAARSAKVPQIVVRGKRDGTLQDRESISASSKYVAPADLPPIAHEVVKVLLELDPKAETRITPNQLKRLVEESVYVPGQAVPLSPPAQQREDYPDDWREFLTHIKHMAWMKKAQERHDRMTITKVVDCIRGYHWDGGWLKWRPELNRPRSAYQAAKEMGLYG